jgi:hypothetical protein
MLFHCKNGYTDVSHVTLHVHCCLFKIVSVLSAQFPLNYELKRAPDVVVLLALF